MTVKITPNDKGNPRGKLADAELHFTEGPLDGLKLIGFSIWERRAGAGRNVTLPARLAKQPSASGQVSERCPEVARRPLSLRLEVLPWADFEGGRNAAK